MIENIDIIYNFTFKGILTESSLDKAGRKNLKNKGIFDFEIAKKLSLDMFDKDIIDTSRKMAGVYVVISSFENSVRKLIEEILEEEKGEKWWSIVPKNIQEKAEKKRDDEEKIRWHTQRGKSLIYYTTLGDLNSIIKNNWSIFEPYFHSQEWIASIFDAIERSRNVIMHSGTLDIEDIERLGIYIRDWFKQVAI